VPWRYRQMALVLLAAILRTPDRLLPPSPLALHFPHNHTLCTPPFGERVTPSQLFDSLASLTQDDIISVRTAAKCALITLLRCYKPSDRIDANIDVSAREYLDNNREILVAKAQALITNKDWLMKALEQAERDHTVLGEEDKDSQKMSRAVQQRLDALSRFVVHFLPSCTTSMLCLLIMLSFMHYFVLILFHFNFQTKATVIINYSLSIPI